MALCEHLRSHSQRNGIATEVLPRPAFEIPIAAIAASLSAGEETRTTHPNFSRSFGYHARGLVRSLPIRPHRKLTLQQNFATGAIGHLQPVADVQRTGLSRLGTSAKETGIQTYEE
jgi:hypothetical protein